jgi:glycyl-tRNA synthetase beta chain
VKDPFALRRASLGVLRTIIENKLTLDLAELVNVALASFKEITSEEEAAEQVLTYLFERLRGYAAEQGYGNAIFESVLAVKPSRPLDFMNRLGAVAAFEKLEQAESLAAANKRIANILRKNDIDEAAVELNASLLTEEAEKVLTDKLLAVEIELQPLFTEGDYTAVLTVVADMREAVDCFFDSVMVVAEDEAIRQNRLALLTRVRGVFLQVADISQL